MGTVRTDPMVEVETDDEGNAIIYRRTHNDEYRVVIPPAHFGQVAAAIVERLDGKELVNAEEAEQLRAVKSALCKISSVQR